MSTTPRPRRRALRVIGVIVLALVVVVLLVVALLPTLAGLGPGRRMVASTIGAAIGAEVTVDRLSLAWFGEQSIGGLRAVAVDGTEVLNVNASIDRSIVALVRGGWRDSTITIDGLAHVHRGDDGSVTIAGARPPVSGGAMVPVPVPGSGGSGGGSGGGSSSDAFRLPMPLSIAVDVATLDLRYTCSQTDLDIRLPDLAVAAKISGSAPITLTLRSSVESDGQRGSIQGDVKIENAIAADGSVALANAQIEADLRAERVRGRFGEDLVEIEDLRIAGSTSDLAQGLDATITAAGRATGANPVSVDSDLKIHVAMPEGDWLRTELTLGGTLDAVLAAAIVAVADASVGATSEERTSSDRPGATTPGPDATSPAGSSRPPVMPAGLDATIRVDGLAVTLADEGAGRRVIAQDLVGEAVVGTERPLRLTLSGTTEFEEPDGEGGTQSTRAGRFSVDATANGLVDSIGMLRLDGAAVELVAAVESLILPLPDRVVEIASLNANVDSTNLSESVHLRIAGNGTIDGSTQSRVDVDLVAEQPVSSEGEFSIRPDRLRGSVTAENLPLALVEPLLTDLPIVVDRDLGERLDMTVSLPGGGDTAEARIVTERLTATAVGRTSIETALQVDELAIDWRLPVALLTELGVHAADEISLSLRSDGARVPLIDDVPDIGGVSGAMSVAIGAPTRLSRADGSALATVDSLRAAITTESIRAGVDLSVDAALEGGTLAVAQRLTNLIDEAGELAADAVVATGDVELKGVARERVLDMLPADARPLASAILNRAPSVTVRTGGDAARRTASVSADLGRATVATELALTSNALHVDGTTLALTADDAILAALMEGPDRPRLVSAAPIGVTVAPLTIPTELLSDPSRLMHEGPSVEVRVTADRVTLSQTGTPETVGLHETRATLRAVPGDATALALNLATALRSGESVAGSITLEAESTLRDGALAPPTGRLQGTQLQVAALERIAGAAPDSWSNWLGATGELSAEATAIDDRIEVTARPAFAQLNGELKATVTEAEILLPQATLTLSLPVAQVDRLLGPAPTAAPPPAGGLRGALGGRNAAAETPAPILKALGGLKARLVLSEIVIDRGLVSEDGPADPARTRGHMRIDAEPLAFALGQERIEVRELQVTLASDSLRDGVRLNAIAGRPGQPADGNVRDAILAVTATIASLTDAQGRLDTANAVIDADVAAESIPTALVDRVAAMNGRLVAALGPTVSASLRANALSRTAGTLAGKLTSPNGFVDLPRVMSRDGALRVDSSMPIRAELALTPPLRRELLHGINPILADLRTVEQPIRAVVSSAVLPLDGNLRGFNADVQMSIGRMELDSGSVIVTVLDLTGLQEGRQLAGLIEPFNLKVRDGNLTYDDLALKLGLREGAYKFNLLFKGDIDVASTPPLARAITTRLPLDGLSGSIKEVPAAVGRVHVDLILSGPLYSAEGEPRQLKQDVKFGGDVGGIIEDVLKDIFRR